MNLIAKVLFGLLLLVCFQSGAAFTQEHDHNLRGTHPPAGAHDPYAETKSVSGANCCHGKDCTRFYGIPVRIMRGEVKGWMFGKWFIRDDQLIDPATLDPKERGFHHICIGELHEDGMHTETPRCGYVAIFA